MNKENGVASMQFRVKGIECRITDRLAKNGGPYCGADHPEFVHPASQFFQRRIHVRQRENREHLELLGVLAGEIRAKIVGELRRLDPLLFVCEVWKLRGHRKHLHVDSRFVHYAETKLQVTRRFAGKTISGNG